MLAPNSSSEHHPAARISQKLQNLQNRLPVINTEGLEIKPAFVGFWQRQQMDQPLTPGPRITAVSFIPTGDKAEAE